MLVGGEQGSNEWVGQTTISTAHIPAEDHDASPANPSTWTSPSSPLNISCGVLGVHNVHRQAHNIRAHRPEQMTRTYAYGNTNLNLSKGCKNM